MKKIIIAAIDFSKGSMNALDYAISVANKMEANVLMVWVDKPTKTDSVYSASGDEPKLEAKRRFEELVEEYHPKLTGGKLMFKIRSGAVHHELVNQAKYHDATMVVAGTHGVSGFEEFWIGSNANKIVTFAECPVMTIRYETEAHPEIMKILLPIDSTIQTRQKVPYTAQLASLFDAEIHILSLYSSTVKYLRNLVKSYTEQVAKFLDEEELRYQIHEVDADNVTTATIEFAKSIEADLISVMTEQETTTANILLGTYAQQMVNHSPIPVLSIRNKSIYDYQTK